MENKYAHLVGARIRDVLPYAKESCDVTFLHEDSAAAYQEYLREQETGYFMGDEPEAESESAIVMTSDYALLQLTDSGRETYSELLDAQIKEIHEDPEGFVMLVGGIEPQKIREFVEDYEGFQEAEELMGMGMY